MHPAQQHRKCANTRLKIAQNSVICRRPHQIKAWAGVIKAGDNSRKGRYKIQSAQQQHEYQHDDADEIQKNESGHRSNNIIAY